MTGCYIPGVKGGGPIQSIKNLVDNLSDRIEFYIVTSDRDVGDDTPFPNIKTDEWVQVGKAKVLYTDASKLTFNKTKNILNSVDYDVMYLNSFFSNKFSIIPVLLRKLNRISKKSIVLGPRGEFSKGALDLKNRKKNLYIKTTKKLGLYKEIYWHATAESEKKDIERVFGNSEKINVAGNLTANYDELKYDKDIEKNKGELKIVFISRVHPKKNLKKAIEFLYDINGEVEFNIYGPIEDNEYWLECEKVIKGLPENIKVSYKGSVKHEEIMNVFKAHHIFLFPTLGENYGHVISEALIGGCPVIISDQTPWREFEKYQVGWDIKLTNKEKFIELIQYCVNLEDSDYKIMSLKAFKYGKKKSNNSKDISSYLKMFE